MNNNELENRQTGPYKELQRAYLIERDGREVIVPIAELTHDELLALAAEERRKAAEYQEHADQLRQYIRL